MVASSPMPRGPALEEPGPQLALLGPGQAHHLLGVVGRALNERQRLEHRVVDVGRHLGPLLGQGPGLALGHEVAQRLSHHGPKNDHEGGQQAQYPVDVFLIAAALALVVVVVPFPRPPAHLVPVVAIPPTGPPRTPGRFGGRPGRWGSGGFGGLADPTMVARRGGGDHQGKP
jgi:hypothetical protein